MYKKMYYFTFWQTLFFSIYILGADVAMIVLIVTNFLPFWVSVLPTCLLFFGTWHLFHTGFWSPIYLNDTNIKFKGKEYLWDDIKITAYPEGQRSLYYQYVLYIGLEFYTNKKEMKKNSICQVYLNEKNLDMLLAHYNKKILVIDSTGFVQSGMIKAKKQLKIKFEEHNKKFEKKCS